MDGLLFPDRREGLARTLRHVALLALVIAALSGIAPSDALAWSNGPSLGDGFGTHDWILHHAIRLAGDQADWVDRDVALLASDDPDTEKTDSAYHLYRERGISRGAPQEVADLYHKAVLAQRRGDKAAASKALGVLSHYYADVLVPFHSAYDALEYDSLHRSYELAVDAEHRRAEFRPKWIVVRDGKPVRDIRRKTIQAASYSRTRFHPLVKAYSADRRISNPTVDTITRELMSRAANDLADIIRTIPTGAGVSIAPSTMSAGISKRYPAQRSMLRAHVVCTDSSGTPLEAVAVTFTWRLADAARTVVAYTNEKGEAHSWENIGAAPLMARTSVTASASSGGTSRNASTWFMATRPLAAGRAGIATSVSNQAPRRRTKVTVSTRCADANGKPVAGLPVTFTWKHRTKALTYRTVTDSRGVARHTRDIGAATVGYRVSVVAQVMAGGVRRSSSSWFTPR